MEKIIENQLGVPLYAAGRVCVKIYSSRLKKVNITYTQYLVLRILWKHHPVNIKTLGEILFLDSGTLTPVLKKLERIGLVTRRRQKTDDRVVEIRATERSQVLSEKLSNLPNEVAEEMGLTDEECTKMYEYLEKILHHFSKSDGGNYDD